MPLILKRSFLIIFVLFIVTRPSIKANEKALWLYKTDGRIYSTPLITEGTVYFGSGDSSFYALDRSTGAEKWQYKTNGAVHSSPASFGNLVLFASSDGVLHALESKNGTLVWQFKAEKEEMTDLWDYYLSSPAVADTLVYWGSGDGKVYAIDANNGIKKWQFQTGAAVHATPVIYEGDVYVGSFDGFFYCLSLENGALQWKFNTTGATYFPKGAVQRSAVIDDEMVYFGSRDYNFYALNAEKGYGHWNFRHTGGWFVAPPLVEGDYVYAGTSDGHTFYCFHKKNGEIIWQAELNMRVYGRAAYHKGLVYFGTFGGDVLGMNALTGKPEFKFVTEGYKKNSHFVFDEDGAFKTEFEIYGEDYLQSEKKLHNLGAVLSTPVIKDNILYVGSSDGYFYAIQL